MSEEHDPAIESSRPDALREDAVSPVASPDTSPTTAQSWNGPEGPREVRDTLPDSDYLYADPGRVEAAPQSPAQQHFGALDESDFSDPEPGEDSEEGSGSRRLAPPPKPPVSIVSSGLESGDPETDPPLGPGVPTGKSSVIMAMRIIAVGDTNDAAEDDKETHAPWYVPRSAVAVSPTGGPLRRQRPPNERPPQGAKATTEPLPAVDTPPFGQGMRPPLSVEWPPAKSEQGILAEAPPKPRTAPIPADAPSTLDVTVSASENAALTRVRSAPAPPPPPPPPTVSPTPATSGAAARFPKPALESQSTGPQTAAPMIPSQARPRPSISLQLPPVSPSAPRQTEAPSFPPPGYRVEETASVSGPQAPGEAPAAPNLRILSSAPPKPRLDQRATSEEIAPPPPPAPTLAEPEDSAAPGEQQVDIPVEPEPAAPGRDADAGSEVPSGVSSGKLESATDTIDLVPESDRSPAVVLPPRRRAAPSLPRRPAAVPAPTRSGAGVEAGQGEAPAAVEFGDSEPEITEIAPPAEASDLVVSPSRAPRPPPPRLKRQPTGETPAEPQAEQGRKRLRSPWWEEMFSEDFAHADHPPTSIEVAKEVDFMESTLALTAGGVILDLGCGGGHYSVELAARGYGVVGFDLSVFQLAVAADLAQERGQRINFLQGDMRDMAFEETFDGVVCWNTTFGYFEEEKNFAVAQRMFRALRPGGMLLLDVVNRDYVTAHEPSQAWFDGDACVCMDDPYVDYITSRLRIKRSLIFDDGRTRECVYSLRLYSLHELGKLLHDVGFRVCQASGHPTTPGAFFGPYSPRIIMLAQRP